MGMVGLRDVFVVAPPGSFHHHHHHHQQHEPSINLTSAADPINGANAATALGVGVGVGVNVIPLLTATPCLAAANMDDQDLMNNGRGNTGLHFWQNQYNSKRNDSSLSVHINNNNSSNNNNNASENLLQSGSGNAGGASSGGTMTCQDCGNQAKKDCSYRRCRTCCKSRGFDCTTHVKSTWVPAARRRERQLMAVSGGGGGGGTAGSSGSTSGVKKPRLIASQTTSHTSLSNSTTSRSLDTSSSHQDASCKEALPGQIRAPAVFKCVRVTAMDDGEDEFAYQAVVKIAGHVFKGFLYDQGVEPRDGFPNISELHLGGASSVGGGKNGASSSSPILDPSEVYASGGGGFLGGSSYGNIQ